MCFNISIAKTKVKLEDKFKAQFEKGVNFQPNYFITAFTKPQIPIITGDNQDKIQLFNWGLIPHWVKSEEQARDISSMTFNSRIETAHEKPSFRDSFKKNHCLIIADGFFEWKTKEKNKIPHYIYKENNELFSFAGIWSEWVNQDTGEVNKTCSILTHNANEFMAEIHNTKKRQPVFLKNENSYQWLNNKLDTKNLIQQSSETILSTHIIAKDFRTLGNNKSVINKK